MEAAEAPIGLAPSTDGLNIDQGERSAPIQARSAIASGADHAARGLSDEGATALARRLRLFASPKRLRILWELVDGEKRVGALARRLDASSQLISHQLRIMREAELVVTRKEGTRVYYRLHDTNLRDLLIAIRTHQESFTISQIADAAVAKRQSGLAVTVPSPPLDATGAIAD